MQTPEQTRTLAASILSIAKTRIAAGVAADGLLAEAADLLKASSKGTHLCSACSGRLISVEKDGTTPTKAATLLFKCSRCDGLHGQMYRGDSYALILPRWSPRSDMEGARYFDLTLLGSDGIERSHGYYDPKTKLMLQVG